MRRIRVLMVCSPLMDSVGARTRMFREMEYLADDPHIELAVLWWAGWIDHANEDREEWTRQTRSQWRWKSWVIYPLLSNHWGLVGTALSAIWRGVIVTALLMMWRPHVIHAHQGSLARRILWVGHVLGIRIVTDLHGALSEELAFSGVADKNVRAAEFTESLVVRYSDAIICVSERLVRHLMDKHDIPNGKLEVIPCCIPDSMVGPDPATRRSLRNQLGLADQTVLVYSGGTASYQCVPQMCELFACLSQQMPNLFWLILTWSAPETFLHELEHLGVPSDRHRALRLPQTKVLDYLAACDAALLLRQDHILNHVSSPTKFAEYLAAGLPVIVSPHVGDTPIWVRDHDLGLVIDLPPRVDIPTVVQFLDRVSRERTAYAERCARFAKSHLTWESRAAVFHQAYNLDVWNGSADGSNPSTC